MPANRLPVGSYVQIERTELQLVIDALREAGYCTVGPQVVDEAVVYRELHSTDQLPIGVVEDQDGGQYRLLQDGDKRWFAYANGPDSLKKYLFPPRETLSTAHLEAGRWSFESNQGPASLLAVIGVRACDLRALEIQDHVFLGGSFVDESYKRRRERLFIVAVNCSRAAPTCFCHSMNCGPAVGKGYDLALTEVDSTFVVSVGSPEGGRFLAGTRWTPCTLEQVESAKAISQQLTHSMQARISGGSSVLDGTEPRLRTLDTKGVRELLLSNLDHPRWSEVADRCLACANCTLVCPTCFCCAVEEMSDLSGNEVTRNRVWDSCFTAEHSYTNTGTVRKTTASRYRQWLTHKLATWHDQFGESGCVGCGRCITWCPVGIDLTEEVAAIQGIDP